VLLLSRIASLTLLPIYLLFIFFQIRAIRQKNSNDDGHDREEMQDASRPSHAPLLVNPASIARSIRFQDEELLPGYANKEEERGDSLEMSAFDGSETSRTGTEDHDADNDSELPANEDDLERQQHRTKSQRRGGSIYHYPSRRQRSGSRTSSQRGLSPSDAYGARTRPSFTTSSTSLPRILVGSTVTSMDNMREVYSPEKSAPRLGRTAAAVLLVMSALLVAVCAEFLVDTLDEIVESESFFSEAFIGLIILPAAGNFAELFTATGAAWDGNFDLAIGVSIGSSVQISLLVTPLVVIGGWIMHRDMTITFDLFGTVALFATTFLVTILILHGKSKFLEGSLLIACYFIIGVGAFLFPREGDRAE
jgi:Ca2+:H+ antiporter